MAKKVNKELLALHFDSLSRMSEWTIFWAIIVFAVKHEEIEFSLLKLVCIVVVAFALSLIFTTMAWRAREQAQKEKAE